MSKKFVKVKGVADEAWHLIDVQLISNVITNRDGSRMSTVYLMDADQTKLHSSWDVTAVADAINKAQAEEPSLEIKKLKGELKTLRSERDHFKLLYEAAKNPKSFPVPSKFKQRLEERMDDMQDPDRAPVSEAAQDLEKPEINVDLRDKAIEYYEALGRTMDLRQAELGHICPSKMAGFIYVLIRSRVLEMHSSVSNTIEIRSTVWGRAFCGEFVNILMAEGYIELRHYSGKLERYRVKWADWSPENVDISSGDDNTEI